MLWIFRALDIKAFAFSSMSHLWWSLEQKLDKFFAGRKAIIESTILSKGNPTFSGSAIFGLQEAKRALDGKIMCTI